MGKTRRFWYNKRITQKKGLCISNKLLEDKPYVENKKKIAIIVHDWARRHAWRKKIRMANSQNIKKEIFDPVIEVKNQFFD